jgi:hypothetical protein
MAISPFGVFGGFSIRRAFCPVYNNSPSGKLFVVEQEDANNKSNAPVDTFIEALTVRGKGN